MTVKSKMVSLLIGLFLSTLLWAQRPEVGLPYFNAGVYSTFSEEDGQPVARAYIQIANDNLTFVKVDTGYYAEIQIEVYLTETEREFVFNRSINKKIVVDDYTLTNATNILNTLDTEIPIDPGKYEAMITVSDKNSNKQFSQKRKFEMSASLVSDKGFGLSDVVFFSEFETDSLGNIIRFSPELTNNFSTAGEFIYAYFNSYAYSAEDSMLIQYVVKDDQGVTVQQNKYIAQKKPGYMEHFIRLNRYYFNRNVYTIELSVNMGGQWITKSATFAFFWKFVPNTQQDLDLAIEYLRYIGNEDSLRYIKKRPFEEKQEFFQRFWRSRDPNPDTEDNELMIEYYNRVNFTNKNFSTGGGFKGWLTDRGRIFIKFGTPDEIERHPFEAGSYPYVIWRFYSVQKVFLFIDRSGFGDYELHPSYYYVEYE